MITFIPNVLSAEECKLLIEELQPKSAPEMNYFDGIVRDYKIKKGKCDDHPLISKILQRVNLKYKCESVHVLYYPKDSYNPPHTDNCIVRDGVVERFKDWTHTGIVFLNSEFDGGELIYPEQGVVFLPTPGNFILTPADEFYPHLVNKVLEGDRFTLVFRFIE